MVTNSNELLGQTLGTCTLHSLLGRGGMGAVYLAQQSRPRRAVAVKVLMPAGMALEQLSRAEFLARFRREANAIAALDHVNIMPIYEYGEQEELAYLVMPYVTGGTLRHVLEKRAILPLGEVIPIIDQAAAALDCAHAQGIIHRDLKPGNILFHADGRVLLADFGLAKVVRQSPEQDNRRPAERTALTNAGTIVGTPEYFSPEQGAGRAVDARSDVYALGIVLFQMLAGDVPFMGASPVAIAIKHTLEEPPSLIEINPTIPCEVEAVVKKALAKKPEDRYASAGEFAQALRIAASTTTHQPPFKHDTPLERVTPQTLQSNDTQLEVDIHEAMTQEAVHIRTMSSPVQPVHITPIQPEVPKIAPSWEREQPVQKIAAPVKQNQPFKQHSGCQSVWMMLLGSLLTLLLVVGSFAMYLHLIPQASSTSISQTKVTSTAPTNHPATTPGAKTPAPGATSIPALVPAAGQMLYATSLPGSPCDNQGGQWKNTPNITVKCNAANTELINHSSNHISGTFLEALPSGKPIPNDYVLQVQFITNSATQGSFGVFFRTQPGSQQGAYSFLVDTTNHWTASAYDNNTGAANRFTIEPTQTKITGTVTIDIIVQGGNFTFYLNGTREGFAQSSAYPTGTLGLVVDTGTDVSFKNLALYTLQ